MLESLSEIHSLIGWILATRSDKVEDYILSAEGTALGCGTSYIVWCALGCYFGLASTDRSCCCNGRGKANQVINFLFGSHFTALLNQIGFCARLSLYSTAGPMLLWSIPSKSVPSSSRLGAPGRAGTDKETQRFLCRSW